MTPLNDQIITEGDHLGLSISVTGSPKPNVKWYKNEEVLLPTEDGSITMTQSEDTYCLNFAAIKHSDEGTFKAVVENVVSEVKAAAKITVQGEFLLACFLKIDIYLQLEVS